MMLYEQVRMWEIVHFAVSLDENTQLYWDVSLFVKAENGTQFSLCRLKTCLNSACSCFCFVFFAVCVSLLWCLFRSTPIHWICALCVNHCFMVSRQFTAMIIVCSRWKSLWYHFFIYSTFLHLTAKVSEMQMFLSLCWICGKTKILFLILLCKATSGNFHSVFCHQYTWSDTLKFTIVLPSVLLLHTLWFKLQCSS